MLKVSENRRFLVNDDGSFFPWIGDTAWALFHQLSLADAEHYLRDRASKGFTVIQAVALSEFDGLRRPNANGDHALHDYDPTRPNDAYFQHVDAIVDLAASLGLTIGFLPTWGDKVGPISGGLGPMVFTGDNARVFGRFLGERYRDRPVVWILGGDRNPGDERHLAIWRAMAEGLREGDDGRHLITYHACGRSSSAEFIHDEPWLDFNMLQSGHHQRDPMNGDAIARDYALTPPKPCIDAEPNYEDHPVAWRPELGYFTDWDARKACYWALFAGAFGHSYGANSIFQFSDGSLDHFGAHKSWQDALNLPGARQMIYARRLLEAHDPLKRVPDQRLLVSAPSGGYDHARACRADDGSYALVYTPSGKPMTVSLGRLAGPKAGPTIRATWYDPRTGESTVIDDGPMEGSREFVPPSRGENHDWVLVLTTQ